MESGVKGHANYIVLLGRALAHNEAAGPGPLGRKGRLVLTQGSSLMPGPP